MTERLPTLKIEEFGRVSRSCFIAGLRSAALVGEEELCGKEGTTAHKSS